MAKLPSNKDLAEMLTGSGRSMSFKTTVVDRGYERFVRQVEKVERDKPFVTIGVQENAGMHGQQENRPRKFKNFMGPIKQPDYVHVAQIAAWNEFGTRRIPERSFIRSTIDENKAKYEKLVERLILLVYLGQEHVISSLHILGLKIESDIKRKITVLNDPPNAPSTIRNKGSSNPLIDTGQLRSSIRYHVTEQKQGD